MLKSYFSNCFCSSNVKGMICEGLVGLVGLVNAMSLPGYASVGKNPPWFECLFLTQTKGGTHGFDKF